MIRALSFIFMVVALLSSCKDRGYSLLPKSGGRPYEVLIMTSDSICRNLTDSVLSVDVVALPQSEPCFDVSTIDGSQFNETTRLARSIVIITVDSKQFTTTRIKHEKNVWAKPQIVVYINTPSVETFRRDIKVLGQQLIRLLTRAEQNAVISALNRSCNKQAGERIKKAFGCSMKIPANMTSSKRGHDFLWLSDNGNESMSSICVYSYTADKFDAERAIAVRDSVMRRNIQGETQGMYMRTARESVVAELSNEKNRKIMIMRGLWEMHTDAMGGPFVSHSILDTLKNKVIVAEAFIYAPNKKKRNLVRNAEAIIYTLKKTDNKLKLIN